MHLLAGRRGRWVVSSSGSQSVGWPTPTQRSSLSASPILFSTNVKLKFDIHEEYRGGKHFVWCTRGLRSGNGTPRAPSSDPLEIYQRLRKDVQGRDAHSHAIESQKAGLAKRAAGWHAGGTLSELDLHEVLYKIEHAQFDDWKPVLYMIPLVLVEDRLIKVPPGSRAAGGMEYQIEELMTAEFEILEGL